MYVSLYTIERLTINYLISPTVKSFSSLSGCTDSMDIFDSLAILPYHPSLLTGLS